MTVKLLICDNCERSEERLFQDSHTGKELCVECLMPILGALALSPQSEGDDNIDKLLEKRT